MRTESGCTAGLRRMVVVVLSCVTGMISSSEPVAVARQCVGHPHRELVGWQPQHSALFTDFCGHGSPLGMAHPLSNIPLLLSFPLCHAQFSPYYKLMQKARLHPEICCTCRQQCCIVRPQVLHRSCLAPASQPILRGLTYSLASAQTCSVPLNHNYSNCRLNTCMQQV